MTAATRHDAITGLVFVAAAAVSIVLMSGALYLAQRWLGLEDLDLVIESIVSLVVMLGGGSIAAVKYRRSGSE